MATRADVLRLTVEVENKEALARLKKTEGVAVKANEGVEQSASKAAKGTKNLTSEFASMKRTLLGAAGLIAGLTLTAKKLLDLGQTATLMDRGFETLNRRIGTDSVQMLTGMRRATLGLVDDMELMRITNSAIILGLPITEDRMENLAEGAVKLGRAMGVDAVGSIESLVTGIGRQSRLMLDNIGLMISAEQANLAYAQSLGIAVSELDDAQRKMAFFLAAEEQIIEKTQDMAAETRTLWEENKTFFTSLWNSIADAAQAVNESGGEALTEHYRQMAELLESDTRTLDELQARFDETGDRVVEQLIIIRQEAIAANRRAREAAIMEWEWAGLDRINANISEINANLAKMQSRLDAINNREGEFSLAAFQKRKRAEELDAQFSAANIGPVGEPISSETGLDQFQPFGLSTEDIQTVYADYLVNQQEFLTEYDAQLAASREQREEDERTHSDAMQAMAAANWDYALSSAAAGVRGLGKAFDDTKGFRVAGALLDLGAAISRAFAEHSWPQSVGIAAGIASSLGSVIASMKSTSPASGQGINFGGDSATPVAQGQPTQSISIFIEGDMPLMARAVSEYQDVEAAVIGQSDG